MQRKATLAVLGLSLLVGGVAYLLRSGDRSSEVAAIEGGSLPDFGPMEGAASTSEPLSAESERDVHVLEEPVAEELQAVARAGLRLHFFHDGEIGVPGVRVRLTLFESIPEFPGMEMPQDSFIATSDTSGLAEWSGLQPGSYRWQLETDHALVAMVPAHEQTGLSVLPDGSVSVEEGAPGDLSGVVELGEMEIQSFEVQVHRGATVRGHVGERGQWPAHVRLLHRSEIGNPAGAGVVARKVERSVRVDGGGFVLENVRPGVKLLRVAWQEGAQAFQFGAVRFAVAEGDELDLGELRPFEGHSVTGRVRVDGLEGSSDEDRWAWLNFQARSRDKMDELHRIAQSIEVKVGEPFHLDGLAEGPLRLRAYRAEAGWEDVLATAARVVEPEEQEILVPPAGPVDLVFEIERRVEVPLVLDFPSGVEPMRLEAWFLGEGGQVEQVDLRVREDVAPIGINLPEGHYQVLVHSGPIEMRCEDSFVFLGELTVDARDPRPLEVKLVPAATIEGELLDAQGEPMADRHVSATFGPWFRQRASRFPFRAPTDELGRFRLCGVPPGAEVTFWNGTRHVAGDPYSVEWVTLEAEDFY